MLLLWLINRLLQHRKPAAVARTGMHIVYTAWEARAIGDSCQSKFTSIMYSPAIDVAHASNKCALSGQEIHGMLKAALFPNTISTLLVPPLLYVSLLCML